MYVIDATTECHQLRQAYVMGLWIASVLPRQTRICIYSSLLWVTKAVAGKHQLVAQQEEGNVRQGRQGRQGGGGGEGGEGIP